MLLVSVSLIFGNSDALSANILHIDFKPSGKLFMLIQNKKGPTKEQFGTPARILAHLDVRPLRRTRC